MKYVRADSLKHACELLSEERGVSMALDGVIYRDAWFTPISPESEVVLMPYMEGG